VTAIDLLWGIGVFILAAVYDALIAAYTHAAARGRRGRWRAAKCAFLICYVSAAMAWAFLKVSPWFLVPESFGYALGTYVIAGWLEDRD